MVAPTTPVSLPMRLTVTAAIAVPSSHIVKLGALNASWTSSSKMVTVALF